jgi:hypothetical protein
MGDLEPAILALVTRLTGSNATLANQIVIIANIADLITRAKGLDEIHDDVAAMYARLGSPSGASVSADINAVFDLVNAILTLTETGGTVTTDGTEQNVYINNAPAGVFDPKIVQIDFTNQTAGETVVIREYYRIKSGGGMVKMDEVTFAGVQDPLLKNVTLEENRFGVQVTIQRTAVVVDRAYDWEAVYKT